MLNELTVKAPPVAVIVLKRPVVEIMVPPVIVPTIVGAVIDGEDRVRFGLNCPVPVKLCDIKVSIALKLVAMWETTLTVSAVVARIKLKLGDVVDIVLP